MSQQWGLPRPADACIRGVRPRSPAHPATLARAPPASFPGTAACLLRPGHQCDALDQAEAPSVEPPAPRTPAVLRTSEWPGASIRANLPTPNACRRPLAAEVLPASRRRSRARVRDTELPFPVRQRLHYGDGDVGVLLCKIDLVQPGCEPPMVCGAHRAHMRPASMAEQGIVPGQPPAAGLRALRPVGPGGVASQQVGPVSGTLQGAHDLRQEVDQGGGILPGRADDDVHPPPGGRGHGAQEPTIVRAPAAPGVPDVGAGAASAGRHGTAPVT
jgi:hypothetical protein